MNELVYHREEIIQNLSLLLEDETLINTLQTELLELEQQLQTIQNEVETLIKHNMITVQNQDEQQRQYNQLVKRYEDIQLLHNEKQTALQKQQKATLDLTAFIATLQQQENLITTFDKPLFNTMIDKVVIHPDK